MNWTFQLDSSFGSLLHQHLKLYWRLFAPDLDNQSFGITSCVYLRFITFRPSEISIPNQIEEKRNNFIKRRTHKAVIIFSTLIDKLLCDIYTYISKNQTFRLHILVNSTLCDSSVNVFNCWVLLRNGAYRSRCKYSLL